MSDWTSLNEIMRDLSVAQGCTVPASLEAFGNTAPPTVNIEEETEEAFYQSCGDVDYSKPPDFGLIQEMLTTIRNKKESLKGDILLNSDLNPLSVEFIPNRKHKTKIVKKRWEKNVAIQSILQNLKMNAPVTHEDIVKSPMKMFRSKRTKVSPSIERRSVETVQLPSGPSINNCQYTPSEQANVYYLKYMEKAKLKEQINQDIWSKAEQEMKKRDEVLQQRLEASPSTSAQSSSEEVSESSYFGHELYKVSLQHHRHILLDNIDDCVVCKTTIKHGYRIVDEE